MVSRKFCDAVGTKEIWYSKKTGLHHVDFEKAKISWITVSNGCALENIKLPLDGETFVCDCKALFEKLDEVVKPHFTSVEWEKILQYLHGTKIHSGQQQLMLKTRSDMIESCSHSIGSKLFEALKSNFERSV